MDSTPPTYGGFLNDAYENKRQSMKIKVIAPASGGGDDIKTLLTEATTKFAAQGIELIYRPDFLDSAELPFFASTKETRQKDFIESLTSSEYNVIWTLRGGYGSSGVYEECMDIKPEGKILIGFSDITVLHVLFNQHYNMPSIHGAGTTNFFQHKYDFSAFREILEGSAKKYEVTPFANTSHEPIEAKIMGGNLTVLTNLIGTKLHPNLNGKILLIEDVNEKGYHVHRHLMHLKQAGCLSGCTGILLGDFLLSDENIEPALAHFCNTEINIPCFKISGIGHGEINNPIVLGSNASLSNNILTIKSPF